VLSVAQMQVLYKLPDLSCSLSNYIYVASNGTPPHEWDIHGNVTLWNKFRIQLHSSFRSCYINRSQVVQALPPSDCHPLGCCNVVLLSWPEGGDTFGNDKSFSLRSSILILSKMLLKSKQYSHQRQRTSSLSTSAGHLSSMSDTFTSCQCPHRLVWDCIK